VTAFDGVDGAEVPAELVAVTVKVTDWPSARPGTIAQVLGSSAVIVWPVEAVTVNEVTGAPSTVAGAAQRTVAEEDPAVAVTPVGVWARVAAAAVAGANHTSSVAAARHSAARWTFNRLDGPASGIYLRAGAYPPLPERKPPNGQGSSLPAVSTTPALLVAAAGVGFGHAILPDHWMPLAVVGRTRRYPLSRVARLSGLAGVAHVLVSIVLGAVIVVIGLQLRSTVEHAQDAIVGSLLIATGVAFAVLELTGYGHSHAHDHDDGHQHEHDHEDHHDHATHDHARGGHSLLSVMVPFGAAASPDLTILPVFLAATTAGAGAAIGSVVVFGAVTIATIVGLTLFAAAGGYQVRGQWLERWGNLITAAVLVVIGLLVLTGVV
jgi:nickel/cobalt transporter (NicO) family protein